VKSFQLGNLENLEWELLENEVLIFLRMDHPHITRLYYVYESQHELHLVMECLEGGELFDRISEKKRFSEEEARDALRQMLLALNYIHSHGVVHRDIKLENFVYDEKGSGHLKLLDFGFSKMWDATDEKMTHCCGTMSYVAPEVLNKSYTSQCDLWSLGVIAFILLVGYMPFFGSEEVQRRNIRCGKYSVRPEKWATLSDEAKHFLRALIVVDPSKRLTAQQALEHPWICKGPNSKPAELSIEVAAAFKRFSQASVFRRCCMEMFAWSLSNEERAQVRNTFLSLDRRLQGTITLEDLKSFMVDKLQVSDAFEALQIFEALDYNHDKEIHYSDFLAAMVNAQTNLSTDPLHDTFRRFDTDGSGFITLSNLKEALGSCVDGERMEDLLDEVDQDKDGLISLFEFESFLRGENLSSFDDFHELLTFESMQSEAVRRCAC
jgi:calcium-dependent protein kinase